MRRRLSESFDIGEREELLRSLWKGVSDEISNYPIGVRNKIANFTLQMIARGASSSIVKDSFIVFFRKIVRLLAEMPDLTPDVHTRAKQINDESNIQNIPNDSLRNHISGALFLLSRGRERADAIMRGEVYSTEEAPAIEKLLGLLSRIGEHGNLFDTIITYSGSNTALGDLVFDLHAIYKRDPRFEEESSRKRVIGAVTESFGNMASTWTVPNLIDDWSSSFDYMIKTLETLRSEKFMTFKRSLESALVKLHTLLKSNNYELGVSEMDELSICMGSMFGGLNVDNTITVVLRHGKFPETDDASHDQVSDQLLRLYRFGKVEKMDAAGIEKLGVEINNCVDSTIKKIRRLLDMEPEHRPGDPNPIYGKFLFAPERKGMVPREENTEAENAAYYALKGHIVDNDPISQDVALDLMGALDDGAYSEILHEPKEEYIFRGISLSEPGLREMIGYPPDKKIPIEGSAVINRMMKGSQRGEGSSSWSADFKSAVNFSTTTNASPFAVILVAKRSENPNSFLAGPNGLYKVKRFSSYKHEKESIGLGSIRVYKVYWELTPADEFTGTADEAKAVSESRQVFLLKKFIAESLRSL